MMDIMHSTSFNEHHAFIKVYYISYMDTIADITNAMYTMNTGNQNAAHPTHYKQMGVVIMH
jgi:hypothetical protein